MQEIKKRLGLIDWLILIILASLTFMIIPAWVPFLRKGWMLLIVAMVVIFLKWGRYISSRSFIVLIAYGIIVFLNAMYGDAYFESWTSAIYEFLLLFVPSTLALYCVKNASYKKFINALVYITFIGLLVELVASIIVLESNPGMIRSLYLTSKEEDGTAFMYSFYRLGLMDYSMGHAIPLLIPPLFCHFKEGSRKDKIVSVILIVVCVILTWLSESTTAMLLAVLLVLLGFIVNGKRIFKTNVIIVLFATAFGAVLMSNKVSLGLIDASIRLMGDESAFAERMEELKLSLYEDEVTGDLEARMNLYEQSFGVLSESNIFLGSDQMPGRHSGLIDRFATLGLIGFIPLVLFFIFSLRDIWILLSVNRRIYYLECIVAALLMLSFKAMWLWPIFFLLFIISPCMLVMKQDEP